MRAGLGAGGVLLAGAPFPALLGCWDCLGTSACPSSTNPLAALPSRPSKIHLHEPSVTFRGAMVRE